jgi:PIN domain nuclease of toxin-antitoxin system
VKEYVLDTHTFVWWAAAPKRLGKAAARALGAVDRGKARAWIPAIIAVELTLLREAGRRLPGPAEIEAATKRNTEVRVLPVDVKQALEFALLGSIRDPFDRLIVAAARAAGMPLITADTTIAESDLVEVIRG